MTDGRPAWRITIPAHTIPRRSISGVALEAAPYTLDAVDTISYEPLKRAALRFTVQSAHIDAGVPLWRPYLRVTARLATVEPVYVSALTDGVTPR